MENMKKWLVIYFLSVLLIAGMVMAVVAYVDPFMHYHKPLTDVFYYNLNNERSQNDGITKHFDYDALITGSSMTENFKTTELDKIFGVHSIKVPYSGGSYKELNDDLVIAMRTHPDMKVIVRCLDMDRFFDDRDAMRTDLGKYPEYLYNSNPFDDVNYLFNRDVLYTRVWNMVQDRQKGKEPGITSFNDYENWMKSYKFGKNAVFVNPITEPTEKVALTEDEKSTIQENILVNVTSLADQYPETEFYYFFPPYSAAWWANKYQNGLVEKRIAAEKYIIEQILPHENIHLFSWNDRFDITTDLNNYKDINHYGEWVNSWMLVQMKQDKGRLTFENYESYLEREQNFYESYDYNSMLTQEDYECDYYAAGLLNREITQAKPWSMDADKIQDAVLKNAEAMKISKEGDLAIWCHGKLPIASGDKENLGEYLYTKDFSGIKFIIDDVTDYRILSFYGKKVNKHGQVSAYVYDEAGNVVAKYTNRYADLDDEWHMYVIDLDGIEGKVSVILNGSYVDDSGAGDSEFVFRGIEVR